MIRWCLVWLLLMPGLAWSIATVPTRPAAGYPLVGTWKWTRDVNRCTEVYVFRADGTATVQSGAEKTEAVYTVSSDPGVDGFYRLTIRVTRDYGGRDCADDESDSTGEEVTSWIQFNPARTQHMACFEQNKDRRCFGPLYKMSK